jgi:ribosomal protein L24
MYNSPLRASAYPRVLPNPYELLPFKQTRESYLKQAKFIGTAPALVEGVHVVVVSGEHKGYVGYIIIIREIADGKHVARWAKIQAEYNGTDAVYAKTPGIEVQILHLRRHVLDPPTPFRVLDRVQVVTGIKHRGAIGRIVQVEDEWLSVRCVQESGEHDIIEVEHRRVMRYFMEGDFVCIASGSPDHRGLVVKVCTGGALELYSVMSRFIAEDTN